LAREYHALTVERMVIDTAGRTERKSFEELLVRMAVGR
jgi:hypothetical protein